MSSGSFHFTYLQINVTDNMNSKLKGIRFASDEVDDGNGLIRFLIESRRRHILVCSTLCYYHSV